jgi:hypothetical protein
MPGALTEGSISEEMEYVKDFKVNAADVRRYNDFIVYLCLLLVVSVPWILRCNICCSSSLFLFSTSSFNFYFYFRPFILV